MELRQYFSVLRKWWWLIALVAIVAGGAAYYATSQMPKLYQATTKVMVGESFQKANPTTGDIATASVLAETYIQLVKTSAVLRNVKDQLGLPQSIGELRNAVNANTIQGSQFIEVRATSTSPKTATDIANAVSEQLILLGPASSNEDLIKQREFVREQIAELENKIGTAEAEISQLEASLETTTSVREAEDKRAEMDRLRGQVAQYQQNYTQFINFLAPSTQNTLSILEPAEPPPGPFSPNVALNVMLAVAVGVILSTGVVFLIEYLDDSLKTKEDISRALNASTLGEIGAMRGKSDRLITATEPRSANAEAYRMLRSNISFSSVDKPIKTILVTSGSPSEGKSITTANLAVTMAQAGYRTILLDCDLRKPTQHKIFNISNDVGLTNGIVAHVNVNTLLRPTRVENLRILTTGPLPPNPSELLGSRSMQTLLQNLQSEADVIVIDSPPVLAVTDAVILSRNSDGVLLVVDSGHTKRETAIRSKEALDKAGAHLLGVVLNRMPIKGGYYAYNSKYYSSGNEPSKSRSTAATPSSS